MYNIHINYVHTDKSDSLIPHGQSSQKLFDEIMAKRQFDLYGKLSSRVLVDEKQQDQMRALAHELGNINIIKIVLIV